MEHRQTAQVQIKKDRVGGTGSVINHILIVVTSCKDEECKQQCHL